MKRLVLKQQSPGAAVEHRDMPPGAGLIIAGLASVMLWAVIGGIAAIV